MPTTPAAPASTVLKLKVDAALIEQMEALADECSLADAFGGTATLIDTFKLAAGIVQMRELLTDDVMSDVMALQNTRLGFLTDHDPARAKGRRVEPYELEVVRDCLIEALFRGVRPVGNQFNIIGGSCYLTKAGMEHLVRNYPGLEDFEFQLGVPKFNAGAAAVQWQASWKLDGQQNVIKSQVPTKDDGGELVGIDTRIVCRVNQGQSHDSVLGKAERKLYVIVYRHLTGATQPEGDVGDPDVARPLISRSPMSEPVGRSRMDHPDPDLPGSEESADDLKAARFEGHRSVMAIAQTTEVLEQTFEVAARQVEHGELTEDAFLKLRREFGDGTSYELLPDEKES